MTADRIKKGEYAQIEALEPSEFAVYLMEMGFMPGKRITMLHQAPLAGPIAFKLENSIIALRKSEARAIRVFLEH